MPRQFNSSERTATGNVNGNLVLPARVDVADPNGLFLDQADAALSIDQHGRTRVVFATGVAGAAQTISVFPTYFADSVGAIGSQVTPGAGAVIATIPSASLPSGVYDVQAIVYFSVTGATKNNVQLLKAAIVISALLMPITANIMVQQRLFRTQLNGAQALNLNTIAADAAGTYEGQIIATRVA